MYPDLSLHFGNSVRNTNNTSNTNQSRPQTYQPIPMSVNTRNSSRPNSNINNRPSSSAMQNNFIPRTNNMLNRIVKYQSSRSRRSIQTCLHLLVCLRIQSLTLLSSLYLWLKI